MLRLARATDPAWGTRAVAHLDEILLEQAHLEKKAATNALEMLHRWPETDPPEHWVQAITTLARDEVDGLWLAARELLRRGVRLGRIVTRDPDEVSLPVGRLGDDERLYVYQRSTCRRCGAALSRFPLGGRTIWACPVCQR